jgi:membrane-associated PAP2 superfamily phosphatase
VHAVLPALAFLVLLVAFQELPIDSYVARHWAYDATVNRWVGHGHWWADDLLHTDGRDAILLVIAGLLVTIGASTFSPRLRHGAWHRLSICS